MTIKYAINDRIIFLPEERKFASLNTTGKEVLLHLPVCRLLIILLNNTGVVLSHDELMQEVWGVKKQVVTMNTLYQNISLLRRCLKRAGVSPKSIRTYPKVGFCFFGQVKKIDNSLSPALNTSVNGLIINDSLLTLHTLSPKKIDDEVSSSLFRVKNNKKIKVVYYTLSIFIIALFFVFVNEYINKYNVEFTVDKVKIATYGSCPVFLDKGNRYVDVTKIVNFLKSQGVSCGRNQYVYLTRNSYIDGVIVFICSTLPEEELSCKSSIKIHKQLQI